jgi:hypothetical protein
MILLTVFYGSPDPKEKSRLIYLIPDLWNVSESLGIYLCFFY